MPSGLSDLGLSDVGLGHGREFWLSRVRSKGQRLYLGSAVMPGHGLHSCGGWLPTWSVQLMRALVQSVVYTS